MTSTSAWININFTPCVFSRLKFHLCYILSVFCDKEVQNQPAGRVLKPGRLQWAPPVGLTPCGSLPLQPEEPLCPPGPTPPAGPGAPDIRAGSLQEPAEPSGCPVPVHSAGSPGWRTPLWSCSPAAEPPTCSHESEISLRVQETFHQNQPEPTIPTEPGAVRSTQARSAGHMTRLPCQLTRSDQ